MRSRPADLPSWRPLLGLNAPEQPPASSQSQRSLQPRSCPQPHQPAPTGDSRPSPTAQGTPQAQHGRGTGFVPCGAGQHTTGPMHSGALRALCTAGGKYITNRETSWRSNRGKYLEDGVAPAGSSRVLVSPLAPSSHQEHLHAGSPDITAGTFTQQPPSLPRVTNYTCCTRAEHPIDSNSVYPY